jgi:hypothetical protein
MSVASSQMATPAWEEFVLGLCLPPPLNSMAEWFLFVSQNVICSFLAFEVLL